MFHVHTIAGRYILLLFAGEGLSPETLSQLAGLRAWAAGDQHALLLIAARSLPPAQAAQLPAAAICLDDSAGIAHAAYGRAADSPACWFLIDPCLRVIATAPAGQAAELLAHLPALPVAMLHAGCAVPPPLLIVPRIFEPEFCARLIAYYDSNGGTPSGFMREIDGRTRLVHDASHKLRQDCEIEDAALREAIQVRIKARLAPEIQRAFQFGVTRMERYLIARYDTEYGGHFRPHRDNTTKGTAHRRFAVSLNLNASDYEGGDLRFPEYGPQVWRAPTGAAAVFSCSVLHECTPMQSGARYVFLPFLYDEAAAAIRERNAGFVDLAPARPPAVTPGG